MTFLRDLAGVLAFRIRALRALAAGGHIAAGMIFFAVGFLAFTLVRNAVYIGLEESPLPAGMLESFLRLNLVQILLFVLIAYVPAVIIFSNAIAGDGTGLSFSREEYRAHLSLLLPLWGALFLIAAAVQSFIPFFLVLSIVEISIPSLFLLLLLLTYTIWAIKELNYLTRVAALGVFVLSWVTLPLFYLLTAFIFALPFFLLIPLFYIVLQRVRAFESGRISERSLQRHLQTLTLNPRDADAHYQLGLIHLKRANRGAAQRYFESALNIEPNDADYHYFLGRVFEANEDWPKALDQYEETYRLKPQYGLGDIFREVGKAYLHTGSIDKAIEFFQFFLRDRGSDPEGRYWLAVALQRSGQIGDMRAELVKVLEQARSSPRFFRKENRKWIYRARMLLRQ